MQSTAPISNQAQWRFQLRLRAGTALDSDEQSSIVLSSAYGGLADEAGMQTSAFGQLITGSAAVASTPIPAQPNSSILTILVLDTINGEAIDASTELCISDAFFLGEDMQSLSVNPQPCDFPVRMEIEAVRIIDDPDRFRVCIAWITKCVFRWQGKCGS